MEIFLSPPRSSSDSFFRLRNYLLLNEWFFKKRKSLNAPPFFGKTETSSTHNSLKNESLTIAMQNPQLLTRLDAWISNLFQFSRQCEACPWKRLKFLLWFIGNRPMQGAVVTRCPGNSTRDIFELQTFLLPFYWFSASKSVSGFFPV